MSTQRRFTQLRFLTAFFRYAFSGSKQYYLWLGFLMAFIPPLLWGAHQQFTLGMTVTGLSDQVSWGIYIANFVFLVGVAAAAVTILFPAYVYQHKALKKVAVLGEILAITAVCMCMLFILFHMGRPDRLWHMLPAIGIFNFPSAMLTWDTLVLIIYFLLNLSAAYYYLYTKYRGAELNKRFYLPLVFVSIFWALTIHTVTAFLLNTLPARPMWHHSVLPIRFIATAFVAGPALMIIVFLIIRNKTRLWIENEAIDLLSTIVVACLGLSLFLMLSEIVTELYHPTEHSEGLRYLMFGHQGFNDLVPWFWASLLSMLAGWLALMFTGIRKNYRLLHVICLVVFIAIWIEKGLGLIIPASVPSPIGEYSHYSPSLVEVVNCLGSWALGLFMLTVLTKGAAGVITGEIQCENGAPKQEHSHA